MLAEAGDVCRDQQFPMHSRLQTLRDTLGCHAHTPSIVFLQTAWTAYATEGTLCISAQLYHRRGQRPPKSSGTNKTGSNIAPKLPRKHETHPPWVKWKEKKRKKKKKKKKKTRKKHTFRLDSNDFSFISAGVSNVLSYKRNVWYNLSGGGDSSVVRAPDSWLKGRGFESLLERREKFSSPGSTFCADSYFGIRSTPVLPQ